MCFELFFGFEQLFGAAYVQYLQAGDLHSVDWMACGGLDVEIGY